MKNILDIKRVGHIFGYLISTLNDDDDDDEDDDDDNDAALVVHNGSPSISDCILLYSVFEIKSN